MVATDVVSSGLPLASALPAWLLLGFVFRWARQIDGAAAHAGGAVEQFDRACRAERIGLVNRVVVDDALAAESFALARQLACGPQIAFAYMKDNLDEALGIDHATAIDREADRLLKVRTTQDHREAVRAFAEKREPNFSGR